MTEPPDSPLSKAGAAAKPPFVWVIPALLGLIFAVQCAWFIRTQSFTYDEPIHIAAGLQAWRNRSFGYFNDHPPLARMWFTLPIVGARWQLDSSALIHSEPMSYVTPDAESMAHRARGMNAILGLILGAILWFTTRRMLSTGAANLALALFVLSPSMVAHFSLATTDGAAALFTFAAAAYLVRWKRHPSLGRTLTLGVLLGLLLLVKFSTPPMFLVALFWILASKPEGLMTNPLRWNWGRACSAVAIAALVVWAGYFFHVSRFSIRDGTLTATFPNRSPFVTHASKRLNIFLLVPAGEYIEGLRTVVRHDGKGHPSFFLGRTSMRGGFRLYFPRGRLTQVAPGCTAALCGGGVSCRPSNRPRALGTFGFWPPFLLCTSHSRSSHASTSATGTYFPSIRLFCCSRPLLWQFLSTRPALMAVVGLALLLLAVDVARYAPDYLSYFTPFVPPSQTYKLLSDSNLDWGQGLLAVRQEPFKISSAGLTMLLIKPSVAKACATKALYDIGTFPDVLPDKLRLKVFNHQYNWTLVQAEDPRRHPAVPIPGCLGISWIETGIKPIRAAPF
jgi:hypothetical protein